MKKKFKIAIFSLLCLGLFTWLFVFLTSQNMIVLTPKGMIGLKQYRLLMDATWIMLIVVIPVFVLTVAFAWKYRESNTKAKYTPEWEHSHLAECFWWGVPLIIIIVLAVMTWTSSHELNPYKPLESKNKTLTIQVVALDWKWLFIYPEQGIATVNFIQFPENTPVEFEITADAPMNSFWIPELGGQIYAMPAMRTKLNLIANKTGTFRGSSSNFSGVGFAGMTFTAKATSQADFIRWVQFVKQSKRDLSAAAYDELMKPSHQNPVVFYSSVQKGLFDQIIMKYKE